MSSLVCSLPASLMAGDNLCKTKLSVWVSSDAVTASDIVNAGEDAG